MPKNRENYSIFWEKTSLEFFEGHDVIGDPVAATDNSGVGLFAIQNRLAIHGLDKKL